MEFIRLLILAAWVLECAGQPVTEIGRHAIECIGEDTFACYSGGCITFDQYCDGKIDCADGTDEDYCSNQKPPFCDETHQFLCKDGLKCIHLNWLCNDYPDCDDGSDEMDCTDFPQISKNVTCKGFKCNSDNKCISKWWVCDGQPDCKDESDESLNSCHQKHPHYQRKTLNKSDAYRCNDGKIWLPKDEMCDGIVDCRDGSDEGAFCANWTTVCKKDSCPEPATCYPERFGAACDCHEFGLYNSSTKRCEFYDYCTDPKPYCSQYCHNVGNNYSCSCDEGYLTEKHKYLCFAKDPEAMLFFTTNTEIKYVKVKSRNITTLATGVRKAHGVAFDGKFLFWVENAHGHQAIMRAEFTDIPGTTQSIISIGLENPGDIALDWVGGHLYFSDIELNTISLCKTDGSICTTLPTKTKMPRYVTLGMRNKKMFWADWQKGPIIMTASLDGSNGSVFHDDLKGFATGLALDEPNDRLYYVDRRVWVIRIDNKRSYPLIGGDFYHPYSVVVFENTVYYSDWVSNSIQVTDKMHGTGKKDILVSLDVPAFDLHMYHPVLFTRFHNPCENHTCSHICVPSSNVTGTCMCPHEMELNGTTCQKKKDYIPHYLIVGAGSLFTRIDYQSLGNLETHSTHFDIGHVKAMAFDNTRDTLFVYDGYTINTIMMIDFLTGRTNLFLDNGLNDVTDMEYDYVSDTLYILDAGRGFIEVISVRTKKRGLVHRYKEHEYPSSLCIMSDYGRMLVAVADKMKNNEIRIDSIGLDGKNLFTLIETDLKGGPGPAIILSYDPRLDVVYIADEGNQIIYSMRPQETERDIFSELSGAVSSMSVSKSYVFWTDRSYRLYWTNIYESANNIRSINMKIFANQTSFLKTQATLPPPDTTEPMLKHPCYINRPCADICVQSSHDPPHDNNPNTTDNLPYKCICTPGLLAVGGDCIPLAKCKEDEIYCHRSNVCIQNAKFCDHFPDCEFGEDEEECPKDSSRKGQDNRCAYGYILCKGKCVHNDLGCSSKETPHPATLRAPFRCSPKKFKCGNASVCIERSQVCDGIADCRDKSDEASAICNTLTCWSNEFMCTVGSCILEAFKCDGEDDCSDGSDEVGCEQKCGLGHFLCKNKECIAIKKRCDGNQDCADATDEENCIEIDPFAVAPKTVEANCAENEYPCERNTSICIPITARCDYKVDCPGGTDEMRCGSLDCSSKGNQLFECAQQLICINITHVCDGIPDCADSSDEGFDACARVHKPSHRYPLVTYPADECRDGFQCANGQCIEWQYVCDNIDHCYDSTDEKGLCASACVNHTCEFSCLPTPLGAHCLCPMGLRTDANNACVDIDECQDDVCSQKCDNLPGSFLCSCHSGYALRPDRRSCKADGVMSIIYVSGNKVWSIGSDGHGTIVYSGPENVTIADVAIDVRKNQMYVTLPELGQLIEMKNSSHQVITNIGHPTKLAMDWVTENVYFVDQSPVASCIRVCNIRKMGCARLQKIPSNATVTSFVVDPSSGRMFYCVNLNHNSVLWTASLAGRHPRDITRVSNCSGLAVDTYKKILYVADVTPGRIMKMDYEGNAKKIVIEDRKLLHAAHDVELFEDSIYTLSSSTLKLARCSIFQNLGCEPYVYSSSPANSFVIKYRGVQRDDLPNVCKGFLCPNLCVPEDKGPQCLCDDGSLAVKGACRLQQSELPQLNGGTHENNTYSIGWLILLVLLLLFLVTIYVYACVMMYGRRARSANSTPNWHVRYRNKPADLSSPPSEEVQILRTERRPQNTPNDSSTPSSEDTAVEILRSEAEPTPHSTNPESYMRAASDGIYYLQLPISMPGPSTEVPYEQPDVSVTKSDLEENGSKRV